MRGLLRYWPMQGEIMHHLKGKPRLDDFYAKPTSQTGHRCTCRATRATAACGAVCPGITGWTGRPMTSLSWDRPARASATVRQEQATAGEMQLALHNRTALTPAPAVRPHGQHVPPVASRRQGRLVLQLADQKLQGTDTPATQAQRIGG